MFPPQDCGYPAKSANCQSTARAAQEGFRREVVPRAAHKFTAVPVNSLATNDLTVPKVRREMIPSFAVDSIILRTTVARCTVVPGRSKHATGVSSNTYRRQARIQIQSRLPILHLDPPSPPQPSYACLTVLAGTPLDDREAIDYVSACSQLHPPPHCSFGFCSTPSHELEYLSVPSNLSRPHQPLPHTLSFRTPRHNARLSTMRANTEKSTASQRRQGPRRYTTREATKFVVIRSLRYHRFSPSRWSWIGKPSHYRGVTGLHVQLIMR